MSPWQVLHTYLLVLITCLTHISQSVEQDTAWYQDKSLHYNTSYSISDWLITRYLYFNNQLKFKSWNYHFLKKKKGSLLSRITQPFKNVPYWFKVNTSFVLSNRLVVLKR